MATTRPNGTSTADGSEFPQRLFRGKVTQAGIPTIEECLVHDEAERNNAIAQGWVTDQQAAGNQAQYRQLASEEQQHRDRQAASRRRDELLEQALTKLLGSATGPVENPGNKQQDPSNVAAGKGSTVEASVEPMERVIPEPQILAERHETESQRRAAVKQKLAQVSTELDLYPPLQDDSEFWKVSPYTDRGAFEDWIKTGGPETADEAFRRVLALDSHEYRRRLETWPERRQRANQKKDLTISRTHDPTTRCPTGHPIIYSGPISLLLLISSLYVFSFRLDLQLLLGGERHGIRRS